MNVLVLNAGSSSLKYQLINMGDKTVMAKGNCERIGIDGKFTHTTFDDRKRKCNIELPDHSTAFETVIDALTKGNEAVIKSIGDIDAIGHRIVSGGDKFTEATLITDKVIEDFASVIDFAPLHNPPAMVLIKACAKILGSAIPNVLVFDTAFHQTMPPKAYIFGVPYKYYEQYKLRRYGAHGTSHRYVSLRCAELMGKKPSELKIVTCHLGNGSSITAVDQGKCVDTSMGLTPAGGIIMGTRAGDLDPSVVTFIMDKENISPKEMDDIINKESGFIGISGVSSDNRDLDLAAKAGDFRSRLAQEIVTYQIKKYIGAYSAAMGGIDALVFTAGIGENAPSIREAVCSDMEYLGIEIDTKLNDVTVKGKEGDISAAGARVKTLVIPTDEEYMIALDTLMIVNASKA